MADEPKITLAEFSKEEVETITTKIQTILDEHSAIFDILRFIDEKGTFQCNLRVFKKVEAKDGVVSPIQADDLKETNGGNSDQEVEKKADSEAA